jgi:hypothetical protein
VENETDIAALCTRDFWASLVLIVVSAFFLWRTISPHFFAAPAPV